MIDIVLDENVSLDLAKALRKKGHKVYAIVETNQRGSADLHVWQEVKKRQAVLITRDYHFTNPFRFPPSDYASLKNSQSLNSLPIFQEN
jgi:predicted nuclease of predicted toxin-antitoxin system